MSCFIQAQHFWTIAFGSSVGDTNRDFPLDRWSRPTWNTLKDPKCSKLGVAARQKAACQGGGRWAGRGSGRDMGRHMHKGGHGFWCNCRLCLLLSPRFVPEAQEDCIQSVLALYGIWFCKFSYLLKYIWKLANQCSHCFHSYLHTVECGVWAKGWALDQDLTQWCSNLPSELLYRC